MHVKGRVMDQLARDVVVALAGAVTALGPFAAARAYKRQREAARRSNAKSPRVVALEEDIQALVAEAARLSAARLEEDLRTALQAIRARLTRLERLAQPVRKAGR